MTLFLAHFSLLTVTAPKSFFHLSKYVKGITMKDNQINMLKLCHQIPKYFANMYIFQLWQCLNRTICSLTSCDKSFIEICCLLNNYAIIVNDDIIQENSMYQNLFFKYIKINKSEKSSKNVQLTQYTYLTLTNREKNPKRTKTKKIFFSTGRN